MVAPLPNALFSHCGGEEFSAEVESSGPIDLGRFITAFIVVTGFSLPLVLAHSEIIRPGASIMSLIGGGYVCSYSAPSALHTQTLTQPPRAVSCMGPSWPTLRRSGKTILTTSSLTALSLASGGPVVLPNIVK